MGCAVTGGPSSSVVSLRLARDGCSGSLVGTLALLSNAGEAAMGVETSAVPFHENYPGCGHLRWQSSPRLQLRTALVRLQVAGVQMGNPTPEHCCACLARPSVKRGLEREM